MEEKDLYRKFQSVENRISLETKIVRQELTERFSYLEGHLDALAEEMQRGFDQLAARLETVEFMQGQQANILEAHSDKLDAVLQAVRALLSQGLTEEDEDEGSDNG